MSKRLSFLFIILVLSLTCGAQAQTDINVVNPSFEWADEVNLVTCHGGFDGVLGWSGGAESGAANPDWSGVDVNCGVEGMCVDCRDWHVFPDGDVVCYLDMGTFIYQLTDVNITEGHKYTLTFDGMTWWSVEGWSQPIRASFYYLSEPCIPDYNHIELSQTVHIVTGYEYDCGLGPDNCLDDWEYDLTAQFVAEGGKPYLGEKLGIKFGSPWAGDYTGSSWAWVDDVRLSWEWATDAYDPTPEDGADRVTKNPTLTWKPGLYAAEHEVYFGTDETAVANASSSNTTDILEFDVCDVNNYTPTGPLVLGETYYWKITELNSVPPGGGIPDPPWEGDVWSFRVEGHAYDPSPYNGAIDVIFLGLELEWAAGAEAQNHVVYFGSDEEAVADANESSPECRATLTAGTEIYPITEELMVSQIYYWRIDEKSDGGSHTVKGDMWSFTVGNFLVVENFESYQNNTELTNVWDDWKINGSQAEIFLEWDPNITRDPSYNPSALQFWYSNYDEDIGSYIDAQDMSELDIGSDWTIGGVKALQLWMRGDPCTVVNETGGKTFYEEGWPWVEIESTDGNSGYVLYPADDIMHIKSPYWNEWNIDLAIFDACGVELTAIDRLTIGIGGAKAGQTKANKSTNYMWFDDIRLYPPRCRPELSQAVGDFTGDCRVKIEDLDIMGTDWLLTDGNTPTENRSATLTGFPDETSHWVAGHIDGAIEVNEGYNIDIDDPRLYGLASMSITAWVKQSVDNAWVGIVCSREIPCDEGGEATELGIYGSEWGGPDGLGYDWSCLSDAWQWNSELVVPDDGTWTFIALSADPTGCTLYMKPDGEELQVGFRNIIEHPAQQSFAESFMIGRSSEAGGYFAGAIDDVRIYTYDLNSVEVGYLANQTGEPSPPPVYWYKFDEATGYTAADSGTTTEVYTAVPSIANMVDPEPKLQRSVNFADYAILADNWMSEDLWP